MKKLTLRELLFLGVAVSSLAYAVLSKGRLSRVSEAAYGTAVAAESGLPKNEIFSGGSQTTGAEAVERSSEETAKLPMTPERAVKVFEEAASIKDIGHQASIYRETIKELCRAGYVKEAWEMILAEPGYNRDSQICAFFLTAPLDFKTCAEKIATLNDSPEKKTALQFWLASNFDQYPGIMENPGFKQVTQELVKSEPDALVEILGTALRSRFDESKSTAEKEKINQTVLELHSKNLISNEVFSHMVTRNMSKGPAELWSWISNSSMGVDESEDYAGQLRMAIVQSMVTGNAPEALSKISSNTGEPAVHDLGKGLIMWADKNPKAAHEWYENQRPTLTQTQRDAAAAAFSTLALKYRELEGAENWANQISDPEARDSILKEIHPASPRKP